MKSLYAARTITAIPKFNSSSYNTISARTNLAVSALNFLVPSQPILAKIVLFQSQTALRSQSASNPETQVDEEEDPDAQVQDLSVPEHYLVPSKALEVYDINLVHTLFVIYKIEVVISIYLIVFYMNGCRNQSG